MNLRSGVLVASCVLTACGAPRPFNGGPIPQQPLTPSVSSLMLNPALQQFPSPVPVTVTAPDGFFDPLAVTSSNPALVGAWVTNASGNTATVDVIPIGGTGGVGATPVTVYLTAGPAAGSFTVSSPLCGRPDALTYAQLLFPPSGASAVPVSTPTIYVAGFFPHGLIPPGSPPPGRLHFVVGTTLKATIEGTALSAATPPPGSATPAPVPGDMLSGSEPMPHLLPGGTYSVYLYDDACEEPFLAGTFTTAGP